MCLISISTSYGMLKKPKTKIIIDSENTEFRDYIQQEITAEAEEITSIKQIKPLILRAINADGINVGGISGYIFYGSLVIDVLWIDKKYRKNGIGKQLLKFAEDIAIKENLLIITISTMEWWDVVNFYKKNGYKIEFIRTGFAKNKKQIHLIKRLQNEKTSKNSNN